MASQREESQLKSILKSKKIGKTDQSRLFPRSWLALFGFSLTHTCCLSMQNDWTTDWKKRKSFAIIWKISI